MSDSTHIQEQRISDIPVQDRTAQILACRRLANDTYHQDIQDAAKRLSYHTGFAGYSYKAHYVSGATLWQSPDDYDTLLIDRHGYFDFQSAPSVDDQSRDTAQNTPETSQEAPGAMGVPKVGTNATFVAPLLPLNIQSISMHCRDAWHLARLPLENDPYHRNIQNAALVLWNSVAPDPANCYEDYVYKTQYANGATVWEAPDGTRPVIVTIDGRIRQ